MSSPSPPLSLGALMDLLRSLPLLARSHWKELEGPSQGQFPDALALARHLVEVGWLTSYQADRLLQGHGRELLLGQYVLLEQLGEGGMGQVFKARHLRLDRVDAVKIIRPNLCTDSAIVERFQREARAAARLNHPHIVTVYDADEVAGRHFIAMEYVPGIDLARLVSRDGPLAIGTACVALCQTALGLQHAHERHLVHRDIKPSNLLRADEGGVVKILDLGLARLLRAAGTGSAGDLTADGAVMGTPDYVAPEQTRNAHTVDHRADLYSLGCTAYHLLAGHVPFPGGSVIEKLLRQQVEEPVPLEQVRPEVPRALAAVVRQLLAKAPAERYQTAAEVVAALAPFVHDLPGAPEQQTSRAAVASALLEHPGASPPFREQVRPLSGPEEKTGAPGRAPLRQAPGAGRGTTPTKASATPPGGKDRPAPPSRSRRWLLASGALAVLALVFAAVLVRPWRDERVPRKGDSGQVVAPAAKKWVFSGQSFDLNPPQGSANRVQCVAFASNSRTVAIGCGPSWAQGGPGTVLLWDVVTGKHITVGTHEFSVRCVAFRPDGEKLASGSGTINGCVRGKVKVWNVTDALMERPPKPLTFTAHDTGVGALTFTHDGLHLITAGGCDGGDTRVRLWDAATCKPLATLGKHAKTINTAVLSPDGTCLATGSLDRTVKLWDVPGRAERTTLNHTGNVWAVTFSPDGKLLAAATGDHEKGKPGEVRLWDVATGQLRQPVLRPDLPPHAMALISVSIHPDGKTLAVGRSDGFMWLCDSTTGEKLDEYQTSRIRWDSWTVGVAFSPDGKRLVSAATDGIVKLWVPDPTDR